MRRAIRFIARRPVRTIIQVMSALVFVSLLFSNEIAVAQSELPDPLRLAEVIQNRLAKGDSTLYCQVELPRFYALRQNMPAWLTRNGIQRDVPELLRVIKEAAFEGLRPGDYHLGAIQEIITQLDSGRPGDGLSPDVAADLDMMLTDAFLLIGSHFTAGRINPESIDPEWFANRRNGDLPKLLEQALVSGSIRTSLKHQLPQNMGYDRLKAVYRRYMTLAEKGGWPRGRKQPSH